jgi:hypothetical protein
MQDLRTIVPSSAKNTRVFKSDRTEFLKNYELCVSLILITPLITSKNSVRLMDILKIGRHV